MDNNVVFGPCAYNHYHQQHDLIACCVAFQLKRFSSYSCHECLSFTVRDDVGAA